MKTSTARGFTLIELMIVVAVLGIVAAVAYPSYMSQLAKGRRADAKQAMLELAQKMERYYTERGTYAGATLGAAGIYPDSSRDGNYTLAIAAQTAAAFSVTATPKGKQAGDACGTYRYNQLGEKSLGADASLGVDRCW
jgi:type IV pilus assembly protein PilE